MRILTLFLSFCFIASSVWAAPQKPMSLEGIRGNIESMAKESDPTRQGRRWERTRDALQQNQGKLERRLTQKKIRIDKARQELQSLRERLVQLQGEWRALLKEPPESDPLVEQQLTERYRQDKTLLEMKISALQGKLDRFKKKRAVRQVRQIEQVARLQQNQLALLEHRQRLLKQSPAAARRLALEEELDIVLNRLSDAEGRVERLTENQRSLRRKNQMRLELSEDLWSLRINQVSAFLEEVYAPPFLQRVRYTLKDGTPCYATEWQSQLGSQNLKRWKALLKERDRWLSYRSYVMQQRRLAERDYRSALSSYRRLQRQEADRRLFDLKVRLGLEAMLPTFVETDAIGQELVRSWRLARHKDANLPDLRRLPGSLLRFRHGAGMGLFGETLSSPVKLPAQDPLVRSWRVPDFEEWVRLLGPWIRQQVQREMGDFASTATLQQPAGLKTYWAPLKKRLQQQAEGALDLKNLPRRAIVPGADSLWLEQLSNTPKEEVINAALAEMRLALASIHWALVEQKRKTLHEEVLALARIKAPRVLQSMEQQWMKARRQKVGTPWQSVCSSADNGVLTLEFNREVKLEEARINKIPLVLTGPREATRQFRLFLPPQWEAGAPSQLEVKARLKRRNLPTHKLDVDPTSRSVPLLQPDGAILWKNYQSKDRFVGRF